jgi:hypothetical protein
MEKRPTDPYRQVARVPLVALGGAASAVACGGSAVIDGEGEGGSSTSASSSQQTATSGTQPFECDVSPGPHTHLEYACLSKAGACPGSESEEARAALGALLDSEDCGPDSGCCDYAYVFAVKGR